MRWPLMWKSTHERVVGEKQKHADKLALALFKTRQLFSMTDKEADSLRKECNA